MYAGADAAYRGKKINKQIAGGDWNGLDLLKVITLTRVKSLGSSGVLG